MRPVYLQQHDNETTMPALKDMAELQEGQRARIRAASRGRSDRLRRSTIRSTTDNNMHFACEEMLAFDDAIQKVIEALGTEAEDTLFVTTADHSHAFSVTQNEARPDESIFAGHKLPLKCRRHECKQRLKAGGMHYKSSGIEMASVMFVSGPGNRNGTWHRNYTEAETAAYDYAQPASIDAAYGAHGGEDVGVWAKGPYSWLFSGSMENTQIAYNIKYALCLDPNEPSVCDPLNLLPSF